MNCLHARTEQRTLLKAEDFLLGSWTRSSTLKCGIRFSSPKHYKFCCVLSARAVQATQHAIIWVDHVTDTLQPLLILSHVVDTKVCQVRRRSYQFHAVHAIHSYAGTTSLAVSNSVYRCKLLAEPLT